MRGALLRVRNPETIFAVWASSAPVQAQVDMAAYYKAAERSLTRNCSADWVAVTRFVDDALANGEAEERAEMKFRLLSAREDGVTRERAANASDVSAAGVLMDPLRFYQVSGARADCSARRLTVVVAVLWVRSVRAAVLQCSGDAELYRDSVRDGPCCRSWGRRRARCVPGRDPRSQL